MTACTSSNRDRNSILHMHDNRGMDLIAPSVEALEAIYQQHKDSIFDTDCSSIKDVFEPDRDRDKD